MIIFEKRKILKKFDVVLLTDYRYVNPSKTDPYVQNVLTEDNLVQSALENFGLSVTKKDWNDPEFNWSSTKTALFRTTWDYFEKYPTFKNWLDQVKDKCVLINSEIFTEVVLGI